LTSLVAALDAVLGAVGGVIVWCLLVTTRGPLLTCLCRAVHDLLIVGGVLGGDVARLLTRAVEEVSRFALLWTLPAVLVRLATSLGLTALSLL
jgi:hypothetical protein